MKKSTNSLSNSPSLQQVELIVAGHVQGVNFRTSVRRWSQELGITGFVSNQSDGTVYILAQGTSPKLEQLIQKCYAGPERAQVNQVTANIVPIAMPYRSFSIKH